MVIFVQEIPPNETSLPPDKESTGGEKQKCLVRDKVKLVTRVSGRVRTTLVMKLKDLL